MRTLPRGPALAIVLTAAGCDDPPPPAAAAHDAAPPRPRPAVDSGVPDRTVVRKTITYYHWISTDPPQTGGDGQGVDHGRVSLTLVVEVHKNARNEGWITMGALGSQVAIPENAHLHPDGTNVVWHLPTEGHNDPRMEIFGGEIRTDEAIRAYLSTHPESTQDITPGAEPTMVRLPVVGNLPATQRAPTGQFDTMVVVVIPVSNHRGGRYLVQVLDLLAEPGGYSANGVMNHPPSRAEIDRYTHWVRMPAAPGRSQTPPIAIVPIDRS